VCGSGATAVTAEVQAGDCEITCRPGTQGEGIRRRARRPAAPRRSAPRRWTRRSPRTARTRSSGFRAYQRHVAHGFVPVQRSLAADDLNEYIQHVGSALYAIPPGVRDKDDWWGRALFS
jgi:hypothetical protein